MTITLQDDIAFILMKKIEERSLSDDFADERFQNEEWIGEPISGKDILGHLEYLQNEGYIQTEFSEKSFGGSEPLPPIVALQKAELTEKGRNKLEQLKQNPPTSTQRTHQGTNHVPVAEKDMPFLEKVQVKASLPDIYDARDITVIVFRTMRDMMSTEMADRTASDLHDAALPTDNKLLQQEIADLWKDTNPLVGFLSRVRPPLEIDDDLFLRRIRLEAGLPQGVTPEEAIAAVFSATKDELPDERVQEISSWLPEKIRSLWTNA